MVSCCTVNEIYTSDEKWTRLLCSTFLQAETTTKLFTRREFEMTDTSISEFHTSFYIPERKK